MDVTQWIAAAVAVAGALGAIITAWSTRRKASADAVTAATALFDRLCERQQARIEQLSERVKALEDELERTRRERDEERQKRIELEAEVAELRREVEALRGVKGHDIIGR